jgi:replicative DNA helicase
MLKLNNLFSLEAEQYTIGALLVNPSVIDDVFEIVSEGDFYSAQHQRIFREIAKQKSETNFINANTVCIALGETNSDDMVYAVEIFNNAASDANAKVYARIVKDKSKMRVLQSALTESLQNLEKSISADDAIEFAQEKIVSLESKQFEIEIQESNAVLKNMLANLDTRFREKQSGKLGGLSTGLESLDKRFNGLRNGHLIVLAARPSMGKSALAMQIAQHVALSEKKGVLVFSLEMPTEELYERMTATQGGINYGKIRNGDFYEEDWNKLAAAIAKLKDSNIRVVDAPGLHINQIKAYSRKANRKNKLGLIVVDHINIMRGDGQSREREVATISGGLKALAKELDCPVLALCQLNRTVESNAEKRPQMSHLRESGAIEQDADIVSFLYRDDYYNENSNDKGVVEIITRKFRGGEAGTDYLKNELQFMRMVDMDYQVSNVAPIYKKPNSKFVY